MRLFVVLPILSVFAATPASAAYCYKLALKDEIGAFLTINPPPIGIMLGGQVVVDGELPPHATREPAEAVACPQQLVDNIRNLYNASCLSEDARKKAAAEYQGSIEVINKGCEDMAVSLRGDDVEFYRKQDAEKRPKKDDGMFLKKPGEK